MRPKKILPAEEPRFQVQCLTCGWKLTFSGTATSTASIAVAVRDHRCPQPTPPVKLCVRCKREIGEHLTRCPYCGADNFGPDF